MNKPLPEKLRPKKLENFVGQNSIVGEGKIINKLIVSSKKTNYFPSLIFWGPPGCGKTTLARIIAGELDREFFEFSAVSASVREIENAIGTPKEAPIIFIDEIHRWNKAQQDRLLPHVEKGNIILIGATTENPSFEVIRPLLSRSRVIVLSEHSEKDLGKIVDRGLKLLEVKIKPKAKRFLIESSNGDARIMLNVLEIANNLSIPSHHPKKEKNILNLEQIEEAMQRKSLGFDKKGDEFYDVISAFIKSMRASDIDAALYYLARMVEAGQDPKYIARRMVVFASEDVASPTALVVANAVFRACETVGYPECQENLAAGVVYLASAKKDRRAYEAYMNALSDVRRFGNLLVPLKIRNAPTKLMKELGYSRGYEMYPKDPPATSERSNGGRGSYLPEKIKGKRYYSLLPAQKVNKNQ